MGKPTIKESFEIALEATRKAAEAGKCKAAKSARRRADLAISKLEKRGETVTSMRKSLDGVKEGSCRLIPKKGKK